MSSVFVASTRKSFALLGAFFAFALLTACSPQAPESVAKDYIKAVADNRVDNAVEYFALGDVKENDLTAVKGKFQMIVGKQYAAIQENGGLDSVTAVLVDQKNDKARVELEIKYKNGDTKKDRLTLIKESEKWKISINPF